MPVTCNKMLHQFSIGRTEGKEKHWDRSIHSIGPEKHASQGHCCCEVFPEKGYYMNVSRPSGEQEECWRNIN